MLHYLLAVPLAIAGVRLNLSMIRRRWLDGRPPGGSWRHELEGGLALGLVGYLLFGRRGAKRRELELEARMAELERRYFLSSSLGRGGWSE